MPSSPHIIYARPATITPPAPAPPPLTPEELRKSVRKGVAFTPPEKTPPSSKKKKSTALVTRATSPIRAAEPSPSTNLIPAMHTAAAIAGDFAARQKERESLCADWHEGTAPKESAAGARLDAVLHVVDGALDEQIAVLEDEIHDDTKESEPNTSYVNEHLQSWLDAALSRAIAAEQRSAELEEEAAEREKVLASVRGELAEANEAAQLAQGGELRERAARLSAEAEVESLRSTCKALIATGGVVGELNESPSRPPPPLPPVAELEHDWTVADSSGSYSAATHQQPLPQQVKLLEAQLNVYQRTCNRHEAALHASQWELAQAVCRTKEVKEICRGWVCWRSSMGRDGSLPPRIQQEIDEAEKKLEELALERTKRVRAEAAAKAAAAARRATALEQLRAAGATVAPTWDREAGMPPWRQSGERKRIQERIAALEEEIGGGVDATGGSGSVDTTVAYAE